MSDKVSIIVPVYNVEKYLDRCIESILKQSYINIELILVDDGSKDMSPKICDEWSKKDKRIKVVHKTNSGVSAARNSGLDIATGKYVQFIDSDDWIEPQMTEQLINSIEQYNTELSICGYNRVGINNKVIDKTYYNISNISMPIKQSFSELFFCDLLTSIWNKLYILNLCSRFNKDICIGEDFLFNLEYFNKISTYVNLTDCYYNYFIDNTNSITHKKYKNAFHWYKEIYEKTINFLEYREDLGIKDIYMSFIIKVRSCIFDKFSMNTLKASKDQVLQMLQDKFVITALRNSKPLSLKDKLTLFLMKRKQIMLLYIIYKIKDKG